MRIQHNILAMNAYRNYNTNTSAVAKNLEKLSSGYKINRAGDDAAGLAISEKMRAQITGLNAAQKNVKDGISLVKTAEGAMQEIHDMLNRMDYLATQSANGTYDNEVDRANLQKEVQSLKDEINRIADSANFNGINLLDGSKAEKYTSALGAATAKLLSGMDGSAPSKAGAAEITLKLSNNAATASTKLDTVAAQDGDGSNVIPATNATFTLKVGGVAGDPATKINVSGKVGGTAVTDASTFDSGSLTAGDEIQVKVGDKTYKYFHGALDATHKADDGWVSITNATTLGTELTKVGLTLDTGTATAAFVHATAAEVSGFNGGTKIIAGTTDITALKALQITANAPEKVGAMFDIKVNGETKADGYKIQNGDEITLTAKTAGAMTTTANGVYDTLSKLAAATPTGSTGLAGSVTATNGKDEGFASPAIETTKYEIKFDIANLAGGKKIDIGGKTLTFSALDPSAASTTNSASANIINLNKPDANTDGSNADEIAADIKTALNTMFGTTDFQTGDIKKNADGTYTYSIEAKADGTKNEAANLGQVRVFQANVDGTETEITETDKAISATYSPKANAPTGGPTPGAFASVQYNIDKGSFKVGNKLTIGGVEIEMVDAAKQDLKNGKVGVDANFGSNLVKALEQNGYQAGQVTATGDVTNANLVLTIKGTTVGEKAAALKEGAGAVSLLDAAKAPASKATVDGATDMTIEAGKTTIQNLKDAVMPGNKKLSDLFNITVNGNTVGNDYTIKEGDEIKFTAKVNGRFKDDVMAKFGFDGSVDSLTKKNGFDEGETASGDKTHYELTIDLAKVAGGNSFTFGNVNGKSITFDLSYDDVTTKNDTVGADKNEEVPANNNSDRVTINLYGLSASDAQAKIYEQVKTKMGEAGFDVTRAINGNKMTLNLDAQQEGAEYNLGNIRLSSQSGALTNAVYNPAGGNAGGTKGTMAQVTYDFDLSMLQAGDSLTVGGTTIHFGDETKKETVDGATKFTVSVEEAKADPNKIVEALESAGYRSGQIRFDADNNKVSITGIKTGETAAELQDAGGKISMSSTRKLNEGGLTLQIGDTADDFNQMTVSIGDMHTKGMGIDGLDISTQAGAKDAIDVIKNAINYVSGIRGDLGATQNRLEHTANNLSIMAENIQDAESTIRDTDVAEEMMAYTKNNILVQSAQAMLAQANQVPQGVLQLLG